jgi:hypothetical protein
LVAAREPNLDLPRVELPEAELCLDLDGIRRREPEPVVNLLANPGVNEDTFHDEVDQLLLGEERVQMNEMLALANFHRVAGRVLQRELSNVRQQLCDVLYLEKINSQVYWNSPSEYSPSSMNMELLAMHLKRKASSRARR